MLHSAYDRLSDSDKNYVDGLLQKFYKTVRDQRIIDEVNGYEETEPDAVVNEMHSIFGTEVASLPAPLENYYDKYFTNRRVVTDFASNYRAEFTSREGKVKADDARLSQMKVQIDAQEKSLNSQLKQINADRAKLDSLRNSGQIDKYNAMVQSFNSEVEAYNAGVGELKEDIASYNRLVAERNSIAADLASLGKSIDTRLTTQSAQ
ncbi:MAG TPA: hypothetical protein VFW90_02220 [Candidatus Saccharimonadales bacterium]|nr:hypothetical protein [Candidatus Saccharimonadales bacterium]